MNCGKLHINVNKLGSRAVRPKAGICGFLVVGIACSNPAGDMDVGHLRVLYFVRGLCDGQRSLVQRSPNECECLCVCVCVIVCDQVYE
jgi:hypothetical protein